MLLRHSIKKDLRENSLTMANLGGGKTLREVHKIGTLIPFTTGRKSYFAGLDG